MLSDFLASVSVAASIATAVGVVFAAWQLILTKRLAETQFEDQVAAQYRELIRRIPVEALLGGELPPDEVERNLDAFYHYFDLSNEQVFLHLKGRIRDETWREWSEGIRQNLDRPAFRTAWARVASRATDSFEELRQLVPPEDSVYTPNTSIPEPRARLGSHTGS